MFYFSEWMWGEEKRHNQLPPRVLPWVTNWNFWISSARKHDNSQDRCWPDHRTGTSKSSSISRDSLWPIWKKCLQITSAYQGETSVIRKTVFKTENSSFVTKFDAWLKKKSRRGPLRLVSIWSCGSWKSSWWDFWTKATCSASRCKVKESVVESL